MKIQTIEANSGFRVLRALTAVVLLAACAPLLSSNETDEAYRLIDSGLVGDPNQKPYWASSDEVLYSARTDEERINPTTGERYQAYRLTLWNVRTQNITWMQEMWGRICFKNGYVHTHLFDFRAKGETPVTHTHGRIGKSLTTVTTPRAGLDVDPATCRPKSESPAAKPLPAWTKGKTVRVLEEIDGILVLDGEKENSLRNLAVSFHPQGAANGIAMPFNSREQHIQGYHPFKGAYFVLGSHFVKVPGHPDGGYAKSPWPEGTAQPYWWLYPDGRVESGTLKSSRDHYDTSVLPFLNGIAWHIGFVRGEGLYVTDTRGERQAMSGFVEQAVTSPDGCRIAMNHRRSINDPWTTGTLKVIELCKGERK